MGRSICLSKTKLGGEEDDRGASGGPNAHAPNDMWLVAGAEGRGKTTTLLQVAADLTASQATQAGERVWFIGSREKLEKEAPDHVIEAWEGYQEERRGDKGDGGVGDAGNARWSTSPNAPSSSFSSEDRRTHQPTSLASVDMRYVRDEEELKGTLACFHLIPEDRRPKALLIDDLDLILEKADTSGRGESSREREAFSAIESRLAKVSALLKSVADFIRSGSSSARECSRSFVVVTMTTSEGKALPYLTTITRWFDRVVEIGDHRVEAIFHRRDHGGGGKGDPNPRGCECTLIETSVRSGPYQPFALANGHGFPVRE